MFRGTKTLRPLRLDVFPRLSDLFRGVIHDSRDFDGGDFTGGGTYGNAGLLRPRWIWANLNRKMRLFSEQRLLWGLQQFPNASPIQRLFLRHMR